MERRNLPFFITYTVFGLLGIYIYATKIDSYLVLMGSIFLLMAAAVHFKNYKEKQIKEMKK